MRERGSKRLAEKKLRGRRKVFRLRTVEVAGEGDVEFSGRADPIGHHGMQKRGHVLDVERTGGCRLAIRSDAPFGASLFDQLVRRIYEEIRRPGSQPPASR